MGRGCSLLGSISCAGLPTEDDCTMLPSIGVHQVCGSLLDCLRARIKLRDEKREASYRRFPVEPQEWLFRAPCLDMTLALRKVQEGTGRLGVCYPLSSFLLSQSRLGVSLRAAFESRAAAASAQSGDDGDWVGEDRVHPRSAPRPSPPRAAEGQAMHQGDHRSRGRRARWIRLECWWLKARLGEQSGKAGSFARSWDRRRPGVRSAGVWDWGWKERAILPQAAEVRSLLGAQYPASLASMLAIRGEQVA